MPTNWRSRQNAAPLKFDLKLSEAASSDVLWNFDKCRPEVADDVISGVPMESVGTDDQVKFGDSSVKQGPNYSTRCRLAVV